jgi:outer membrane protein OmpA-like peptidoglycan-associated protein
LLVAVIRGDPPEGLHDAMRNTLSRIHAERHHALESFNGDSAGLGDVEARLRELVELGAHEPPRTRVGRVVLLGLLALLVVLVGAWMAWWWYNQQLWEGYLGQLRAQPGIVITDAGKRDGQFVVSGLRDPLATDPRVLLGKSGIDPARVVAHFDPYQALDPQFVLKRLELSLDPPSSVTLSIAGNRIVARGSAPRVWLDRAHAAAQMLPAGSPSLDLAGVANEDEAAEQSRQIVERQWQAYVERLRAEPGIVITQSEARGDKFLLSGMRDPLAADPLALLDGTGIDRSQVAAHFDPYQALGPQFVLQRLQASLNPPPGVTLSVDGDRIVAQGSAPSPWISRARKVGGSLPAGAPVLDLSAVRDISEGALGKLRDAIQARSINFDSGKSLPAYGQEQVLDEIASDLKELAKLSSTLHAVTRVTLTGHADSQGQGTSNLSLSVARAEAVRALLKKRGVDPDLLQVRGAGQLEPLQDDTSAASVAARSVNRRVSFSIGFEEEP